MYYIFIENGEINGAGEAMQLDNDILSVEVSESDYNSFLENPLKFCYSEGKIIENPDYETLKQKEENAKRVTEIDTLLKELDEKRIRAVCENEIKDNQTGETWLDYYNSKIANLRLERASLT